MGFIMVRFGSYGVLGNRDGDRYVGSLYVHPPLFSDHDLTSVVAINIIVVCPLILYKYL